MFITFCSTNFIDNNKLQHHTPTVCSGIFLSAKVRNFIKFIALNGSGNKNEILIGYRESRMSNHYLLLPVGYVV